MSAVQAYWDATRPQSAVEIPDYVKNLERDNQYMADLLAKVAGLDAGDLTPFLAQKITESYLAQWAQQQARRQLDAQEYAATCGERRLLPFAEMEAEPQPVMLLDGMLTVGGLYGLAGPPAAGKSLLVRNWVCHLASTGVPCVYAASEGQFDLVRRFSSNPLYSQARSNLLFFDGPLSMALPSDVGWLADQVKHRQPGLIVFDMAYGFGLPDDTGVKDVAPFINGCKRLAASLGCCVLVIGHPGHNGERRFRGSSMWRGAFDGEYHIADGRISCEKHKYADPQQFNWQYTVDYPYLRLLDVHGTIGRYAEQRQIIDNDLRRFPNDSGMARAKRLAGSLNLSVERTRTLIREVRQADSAEGAD